MDSYELKLYNDKHDYIALYVDITTSEEIKELLDWARFVTANSTAWTKGLLNPRHWDEVQGTEFKGVEQYCPQWPKQDFYVECDEEHFDSASFRWTDFYLNNGEELATGDSHGYYFTKAAADDDLCRLFVKDKELSAMPFQLKTDTGKPIGDITTKNVFV